MRAGLLRISLTTACRSTISQAKADNVATMSSPAATANTNTASHDEEPSRARVVSNLPPVQQVRTNHLGYDLGSGSGSGTHHFQIFAKVSGARTGSTRPARCAPRLSSVLRGS